MRQLRLVLLIVLGIVAAPLAFADVFTMKDGRTIEGVLVRETATAYVVKTIGGEQTLEKSQVASHEKKKTAKEEYDERVRGIKASDAEGFYQLGLWCEQNKLKADALRSFKRSLEIDPQHEGAHKALGHVEHQGAWMTPGERDALIKKQKEEALRASGKVQHKGQWVTAEEKANLEKGLVKVGEEWMTPEDKAKVEKGLVKVAGRWITNEEKENLEKGLYNVDGKWISKEEANTIRSNWDKAWEVRTEHYLIKTNRDIDFANHVAEIVEKEYAALKEFIGIEPKLKEPLKVFIVRNIEEYRQFGNNFARGHEAYHSSQKGSFHAVNHPETPAVAYYYKDEAYNYLWTDPWLYHVLAEQYLAETLPNITSPWLVEGIATYFELFKFFRPEMRRYRKMVTGERFIKLADLMKVERLSDSESSGFMIGDDVGNDKPQAIQAGLIMLYLAEAGPAEHRETLKKYFQKMAKATNDTGTFEQMFNVKKLEKELQAWIETLN
jgi:hypothetical protein